MRVEPAARLDCGGARRNLLPEAHIDRPPQVAREPEQGRTRLEARAAAALDVDLEGQAPALGDDRPPPRAGAGARRSRSAPAHRRAASRCAAGSGPPPRRRRAPGIRGCSQGAQRRHHHPAPVHGLALEARASPGHGPLAPSTQILKLVAGRRWPLCQRGEVVGVGGLEVVLGHRLCANAGGERAARARGGRRRRVLMSWYPICSHTVRPSMRRPSCVIPLAGRQSRARHRLILGDRRGCARSARRTARASCARCTAVRCGERERRRVTSCTRVRRGPRYCASKPARSASPGSRKVKLSLPSRSGELIASRPCTSRERCQARLARARAPRSHRCSISASTPWARLLPSGTASPSAFSINRSLRR